MSDLLKESLSALMDGEASELELRRLLKSDDPALREQWAVMHRHRDSLHEPVAFANLDISSRVMAELDSVKQESSGQTWRQALSGLAVAASVAAVVVFGGNLSQLGGGNPTVADSGRVYPATATMATGNVPVSAEFGQSPIYPLNQSNIAPAPAPDALATQQARERFEALLRKHTDNAALNNGQGIISYARVAQPE
ncbi:sigma-E factor negative regulatory protein [Spongiibacter sp. KMU-158]|uniref:Sigma-E factor negative regulatory protein n=1 Tax=Spongiibacter pelagi TaxID=2760804 RepID=A0A927GWM6_9GAMM|nr:sigma-E factor negative regulatory protein [Spongiibacter pelagi]MBD2858574.1 sigma-E factor negative regulatory protein [Spongiibacter pelagi]